MLKFRKVNVCTYILRSSLVDYCLGWFGIVYKTHKTGLNRICEQRMNCRSWRIYIKVK